jgi:hypothetical protein
MPDNNILVLRESSSVEKLGWDIDLSVQVVILEDIPRPVPMHTLLEAKGLQEMYNEKSSHGLYVVDAHPLGKGK